MMQQSLDRDKSTPGFARGPSDWLGWTQSGLSSATISYLDLCWLPTRKGQQLQARFADDLSGTPTARDSNAN